MSPDTNKAAYRRFYEEFLSKGNLDVVDEVVDPNVVSHSPFPGQKPGAEGLKEAIASFREAFPDLRATAEDVIAAGDKVVGRFTVTGTHRGEFMDIVPTGKTITYDEIVIVRFKDGRIVEHWAVADALAMMQQLGVIPE
jgi:predicted ester cyclase